MGKTCIKYDNVSKCNVNDMRVVFQTGLNVARAQRGFFRRPGASPPFWTLYIYLNGREPAHSMIPYLFPPL